MRIFKSSDGMADRMAVSGDFKEQSPKIGVGGAGESLLPSDEYAVFYGNADFIFLPDGLYSGYRTGNGRGKSSDFYLAVCGSQWTCRGCSMFCGRQCDITGIEKGSQTNVLI